MKPIDPKHAPHVECCIRGYGTLRWTVEFLDADGKPVGEQGFTAQIEELPEGTIALLDAEAERQIESDPKTRERIRKTITANARIESHGALMGFDQNGGAQ